jgi:hypothetical protein
MKQAPPPRKVSLADSAAVARVVVFEKIGPGAAEIDLKSGRVTRGIRPAQGRWFYGHGAFSPDGKRSPTWASSRPSARTRTTAT